MNNRQNGRRRGRGGQQARNGQPGNIDRGNRIDNRARGNAAQLLEKYRNLARDAQMQGDRVNTEYYLQFADHYFRVLSESRARFEEQRGGDARPNDQRQRRDDYRDDFDGGDGDGNESEGQRYDANEQGWNDGEDERPEPREQPRRRPRFEEPQAAAEESDEVAAEPQPQLRAEGERRPRRPRAPRAAANGANGFAPDGDATEPVSERIEIDRLPQALSPAPSNDDNGAEIEVGARPRRRAVRRPRETSVES